MSLDLLRRPARPRRALALAPLVALAAFGPAPAHAAPPGSGADAKPVHVLHLASSGRDSYDALRLTKDLEQRFVGAKDARLINTGKSLLELLDEAKCGRPFVKRTLDKSGGLDEGAERDLDAPCLTKVAASLGAGGTPAERFVWGWLGREPSGQSFAVVHLWQKGQPDRRVRLSYTSEQSARTAERVYLKLWHAGEVGDVRVAAAAAEGNLWVDDQDRGPFAPGVELTLRAGEHVFEVRQRAKVAARAKATVPADRSTEVRLEPVVEAAPPVASTTAPATTASSEPALNTSPPYEPPRRRSVLPWVAFGVGAAALVGSGVFFALRQGKESDLEGACPDGCPPSQRDNIAASNRYGALSLVFGGVGVAAVGVGVWALLQGGDASHAAYGSASAPAPGRARGAARLGPASPGASPRDRSARPWLAPAVRYDVRPLPGGAAATLSANF